MKSYGDFSVIFRFKYVLSLALYIEIVHLEYSSFWSRFM